MVNRESIPKMTSPVIFPTNRGIKSVVPKSSALSKLSCVPFHRRKNTKVYVLQGNAKDNENGQSPLSVDWPKDFRLAALTGCLFFNSVSTTHHVPNLIFSMSIFAVSERDKVTGK